MWNFQNLEKLSHQTLQKKEEYVFGRGNSQRNLQKPKNQKMGPFSLESFPN